MGCRSTVFGREPWINTIIGGVASSISSKSALATKLGISESTIKRFEIVGSDVRAHITASYIAKDYLFQLDTNIKSFYDYGGKMYLNNTSSINLFDRSTIEYGYFPAWSRIPGVAFANTPIKSVYAINANRIEYRGLADALSLNSLTTAPLLELWGQALYNSNYKPDLSAVTLIRSAALYNTKYTSIYMPALTSVTESAWFMNMALCKTFNLPNIVNMPQSANVFQNCTSAELISMKKLKTFGSYSGSVTAAQSGFSGLKIGCIIQVHINQLTVDGGSANPCLLWAKANRAAIVEFYDDNGDYVSTL